MTLSRTNPGDEKLFEDRQIQVRFKYNRSHPICGAGRKLFGDLFPQLPDIRHEAQVCYLRSFTCQPTSISEQDCLPALLGIQMSQDFLICYTGFTDSYCQCQGH